MLGDKCSHGKAWNEDCPECDLVWAKRFEAHWGRQVDEARKVIAEAEGENKARMG